jgi:hypothetical protein
MGTSVSVGMGTGVSLAIGMGVALAIGIGVLLGSSVFVGTGGGLVGNGVNVGASVAVGINTFGKVAVGNTTPPPPPAGGLNWMGVGSKGLKIVPSGVMLGSNVRVAVETDTSGVKVAVGVPLTKPPELAGEVPQRMNPAQ